MARRASRRHKRGDDGRPKPYPSGPIGANAIRTVLDALEQAARLLLTLDPTVLEITLRSLHVTLVALLISTAIGVPLGIWLALGRVPLRRLTLALIYTGMGLPPVVVGLFVYILFSRSGPFGDLAWLFSLRAMIVAQTILATPLVAGITMSSIESVDPELRPQLRALGATRWQVVRTIAVEARFGILLGVMAGFGAIISEVGAVMLVGGNIEGRTRVLTTAIVLETRRGHFALALALGAILLALSFLTNALIMLGQGKGRWRR